MDLTKAYDGCDNKHASILIAHQPKAAKMAIDSQFELDLVLSGLLFYFLLLTLFN